MHLLLQVCLNQSTLSLNSERKEGLICSFAAPFRTALAPKSQCRGVLDKDHRLTHLFKANQMSKLLLNSIPFDL